MSDTGGTNESLADKKKRMLHDAQNSIAQLLHEIKQHLFPHYPMENRNVQNNTKKKMSGKKENSFRDVPRDEPATQQGRKVIHCTKRTGSPRRATGATRDSRDIPPITVTRERSYKIKAVGHYTPGTPKKKTSSAPVSLKKSKTWGTNIGTVKYKRKIVATTASSRPKHHQGINKSLNENAVVPASDVEISSSDYSRSPSPFLPSDSGTDTENSGEEGEVKNNLENEMSDQSVFGNISNKQGKEIVAQPDNTMKNNAGVEEEKISSGPTGQDKEKASRVELTDEKRADPGDTNQSTKIAAQQDGYRQTKNVPSEKEAEPSDTEIDTDKDDAPGEGDEEDEKTAIPSQPNINKIITVTKITTDKIGDKVGEDKVGEPQKRDQKKGSDEETWNR
jgi:hypothetical protein